MEYFNIFVKSIFIDNMIFAFFLGMCSYLLTLTTTDGKPIPLDY